MRSSPFTFRPTRWLPGGHLQTLYSPLFRATPRLQRHRERITLEDGDFIDLDWYGLRGEATRCAILLHGLTGSSSSLYILGQQQALAQQGWQSVAVNWRGCSGEPNHRARGYHSGASEDLADIVTQLAARYPNKPLVAVGYSLGGNVLLKYLGETGSQSMLRAAVAVSVPFRLDHCAERIRHGFSRVYQARFLRGLRHYVESKQRAFRTQGREQELERLTSLETLDGMETFWDFDGRVTAPLHGFASAEEYYRRCSSAFFVSAIQVPTLIVHAQDDPFIYPHSVPEADMIPECVTLELWASGGHVGFIEGAPWRPRYYLEHRLPDWLGTQVPVCAILQSRQTIAS
ncbi:MULTISPECIES: hydrolase [Halomonadaceae]|uniref:hydrolase n=1 Tax=Halomonadaceae TaxID=28256 RepID=UPI001C624CC5|nr:MULTISPECIES: hydrolase [Halomonas]MCG7591740.1 hydrolase [Halomonas sp. McD50-5]MCG7614887.1 hydrolase [Halomonas sp. McD50-4]